MLFVLIFLKHTLNVSSVSTCGQNNKSLRFTSEYSSALAKCLFDSNLFSYLLLICCLLEITFPWLSCTLASRNVWSMWVLILEGEKDGRSQGIPSKITVPIVASLAVNELLCSSKPN